jgi:oligosaccharide repeat unit polymerase
MGIFVDNVPEYSSTFVFLYILTVKGILIHSFKNSGNISAFSNNLNTPRYRTLKGFLTYLGLVALCLNLYLFSFSFSILTGSDVQLLSLEQYKNEGGVGALLLSNVPGFLATLSALVTPIGYVCFALHFVELSCQRKKSGFLLFLGSLNVPVSGLIIFSRSATSLFVIVYVLAFMASYKSFGAPVRKVLIVGMLFLASAVFVVLSQITTNRFDDHYAKSSAYFESNSVVSVFDYFSQANLNEYDVIHDFDDSRLQIGRNSFNTFYFLLEKIGVESIELEKYRLQMLGDKGTAFIGLPAYLLIDFGYLGSVLFMLTWWILLKQARPVSGVMTLSKFFVFISLLWIGVNGIFGNYLTYVSFGMGVIYMYLMSVYLRRE